MTESRETDAPESGANDVHHEESDINVRAVVRSGLALVGVAVVVHLSIWLLFSIFERRDAQRNLPAPLAAEEPRVPPAPRLQVTPRLDLQELRAQEDAVLNSYAWVDRDAGVVRIPVSEAMKLVLQRGLPSREAPGTGR
jgi:hypothetical protein